MIAKAVYDACAGEDGLIEDPGQCEFEPDEPAVPGRRRPGLPDRRRGRDAGEVVRRPKQQQRRADLSGVPLGSEPYWAFWLALERRGDLARRTRRPSRHELRFYGFAEDPGPDYDVADFDFDKDPERLAPDLRQPRGERHRPVEVQGARRQAPDLPGPGGRRRAARGDAAVVRGADQGHGRRGRRPRSSRACSWSRHGPLRRPVRSRRAPHAASTRCRRSRSGSRRACRPRASS